MKEYSNIRSAMKVLMYINNIFIRDKDINRPAYLLKRKKCLYSYFNKVFIAPV